MGTGRCSGGGQPPADNPLTSEVIDAISDAMRNRDAADRLLKWAAGHPNPADPAGLETHAGRVRTWSTVVRRTAKELADGTRRAEPAHLSYAVLALLGEERALIHCATVGPWKQPKPRPSLKRACDVKRSGDKLLRVAQTREEGGAA